MGIKKSTIAIGLVVILGLLLLYYQSKMSSSETKLLEEIELDEDADEEVYDSEYKYQYDLYGEIEGFMDKQTAYVASFNGDQN